MKKYYFNILVVTALMMFVGCSNNKTTNKDTETKDIKIDGSSTVYPITEAIAEEFRNVAPNVRVTVGVSGTGGGFKKFSRGETDISNASRPIKESEALLCEENNISYLELSVAYDGLAVIINPENDWVDYFTVEELNKIWHPDGQNTLMYWNQIRDEWPAEEIHLFGPGTASGTYDYFAEVICGKKVGTRGDYTASEDDHVLVQGVANDKYGLGFFGLAYYEENKDKLKLVGVDNGSGAVTPSMETVSNGTYSPLSRPIFIYASNKAKSNKEVSDFVNFYLSNAKDLVQDVGYIPLTDEEYNYEIKKFADFLK